MLGGESCIEYFMVKTNLRHDCKNPGMLNSNKTSYATAYNPLTEEGIFSVDTE